MIELSVISYTVREKGLDWQAKFLSQQTFSKDKFEWIVVDGFYHERHDELTEQCRELGVHLIHLPPPELGYKVVGYDLASMGNAAFAHVTTPNIVIIDDHHIFPQNLLEVHAKYLKLGYASIPQWTHVDFFQPTGNEYEDGYDEFIKHEVKPRLHEPDPRMRGLAGIQPGQVVVDCSAAWWWPNSTGVPLKHVLDCGGYDERLNGGTGGTDSDLAQRMLMAGVKYLYVPSLSVYHIDTSGLATRVIPDLCNDPHNRDPFACNQFHRGDPNLVENDHIRTFVEDGVKYFVCKTCGANGIIDSQDVLRSNAKSHQLIPPSFAAGYPRARLMKVRQELRDSGYTHETKCVTCR